MLRSLLGFKVVVTKLPHFAEAGTVMRFVGIFSVTNETAFVTGALSVVHCVTAKAALDLCGGLGLV